MGFWFGGQRLHMGHVIKLFRSWEDLVPGHADLSCFSLRKAEHFLRELLSTLKRPPVGER